MVRFFERKYLSYAAAFIVFSLITLLPHREKGKMEKAVPLFLASDTLLCNVFFTNHIGEKGHALGYAYDLFKLFDSQQLTCTEIIPMENSFESWADLVTGEVDFMVVNSNTDTVPDIFQDEVISSIPIDEEMDICVAKKENYKFIQLFNHWFTSIRQSNEFETLYSRYHRNYSRTADAISPYDRQIKESSRLLGWDWRLLAALIYQESKFKIGVSSSRGAIGLMQVKESVAKSYGIDDIYDPEENIKAGTRHLLRLQNMYRKMGADSLNASLIAIATYNCGEGRMEDIMNLAKSLDRNYLVWDTLATVIPLLQKRNYYTDTIVKLGKFKGTETLKYMEQIHERYLYYKEEE